MRYRFTGTFISFFSTDCIESLTVLDIFVHELGCDELKATSLYSAFFLLPMTVQKLKTFIFFSPCSLFARGAF